MAGQATLATVQSLYLAYYGRPADPEGLNFWANVVEANGGDINVIIKDFSTAPEYQQRFGSLDNPTLVNNLYLQMFGRNAEPDGLAFWVGQITSGSQTLGQVASTISSLASGIDLQVLSARVQLADAFTAQLNTAEKLEAYASTRGIEIGRSYLDQVKSTNVGDVAAIVAKAAETAATLPPTTDGGNTGGGGGVVTPPAVTFIKDASSTTTTLVLSGTATGSVTVSVDATTEAVSITRAGITQTLTKTQYEALSSVVVDGTGVSISVSGAQSIAFLTKLTAPNATVTYGLADTYSDLKASDVLTVVAKASSVVVTDQVDIAKLVEIKGLATVATTVHGLSIEDDIAHLITGSTPSAYITTGTDISVTGTATVAQIAELDTANGDGALTFSLTDTSTALLTDTPDVEAIVAAAASVTVTNAVSIETLDDVAVLVGEDVVVIAQNITDDISNLISNANVVNSYITAGSNVVVTDGATAAQINAIKLEIGSGGTLTFALQDTYAALKVSAALPDAATVIVSDSVDVAKLDEIKGLADVDATVSAKIIEADITSLLLATDYIIDGTSITVTGAATVAQISTLDTANGDGTLNYSLEDNYTALKVTAAVTTVAGASVVTVSDSVNIAQLDEIKALAPDADDIFGKIITDDIGNLISNTNVVSAYITEGTNITLIGGATAQQIAELEDANGGGTVAYALEDTSVVLLSNTPEINTAINAASSVTVSDTVDIAKLNDVKAQVILVDASTPAPVYGKNITDTVATLISGTTPNPFITTGTNITVTGSATAAQLAILDTANGIDSTTTGTLTYALKDTSTVLLSGTSEINAAIAAATSVTVTDDVSVLTLMGVKNLAGVDTAVYGENITDVITNLVDGTTGNAIGLITTGTNITVTDATTVAEITALDTANGGGTLSYALTDTSTALLNITGGVSTLVGAATAVIVTDDVDVSTLDDVEDLVGNGVSVTAQNVTDIATALITGIAYITAGTNVSVTGGATVAQIALLDAANGDNDASGTLTYALEDSIANLIDTSGSDPEVNSYVNNIDNANVTVTGYATVAEIDLLNAAKGTGTLSYSLQDSNLTLLDADNTSVLAGATSIILSSNALGEVTIQQVKDLLALGNKLFDIDGVTVLELDDLTFDLLDSPAALAASADVSIVTQATGVTANDIATVAQATAIYTAKATAIYDITDSVASLVGTSANVADAVTQANNVIATGVAATAAQATVIHDRAGSGVTTYNVSDTYANLAANQAGAGAAVDLTVEFNSYPYFLTAAQATIITGLGNTGLTTIPDIVDTAAAMNTFIAANNWDNTLHYSFAVQDTAGGIIAAIGNTNFITGVTATGLGNHSVDSVTVTTALTIAQSKTFWEAFTNANVGTTKSLTYYEVTDTIANFTNANTATNWVKDADVKTVTGTAAEIQTAQSLSETNLNNIFSQLTSSDHIVTTGSDGVQTLQGSIGSDTLRGGAGADILNGGEGNDYLDGGDDNDTIHGNNGDDTIYGGAGNNILYGDAGRDTIYAGASAAATSSTNGTGNIVYGGAGSDNLFGSAINDTFKFAGATAAQLIAESGTEQDARDYITNFSTGDKITFENVASIKSFGTGTGIATSVTDGKLALAVSYEKNVDAGQWSGSTTALSTRVSIDIANDQGVFDGQADMTIILVGNIDISVSGTNSLIFGG